jgi:hypothetical protein
MQCRQLEVILLSFFLLPVTNNSTLVIIYTSEFGAASLSCELNPEHLYGESNNIQDL